MCEFFAEGSVGRRLAVVRVDSVCLLFVEAPIQHRGPCRECPLGFLWLIVALVLAEVSIVEERSNAIAIQDSKAPRC